MDTEEMSVSALEAETVVAGSILVEPESYCRVAQIVTEDSFRLELPRMIFSAAKQLSAQGTPIDPIAIREWITCHGGTVDNQTLAELMDATPTAANDTLYAEILQRHAMRRQLRELAGRILESDEDTEQLIGRTASELAQLAQDQVRGCCISSLEMMTDFYRLLRARESGVRNVVQTGFRRLDQMLGGGLLRGGLYILAARPGMGKTSFALNIADQIQGGVLFVSLEMSMDQIAAKRLARISGVPSNRLLMGDRLTEAEYEKLAPATAQLSRSSVTINRKLSATVGEIGAMARSVKELSCVIVDYLGLIRGERSKASLYERITEISGALKALALSLSVPVLALAQLNRANEMRANKAPVLSDLRDSGAIEQDADGVLLLHRPDYYQTEGDRSSGWTPSPVECRIAKNRHAEVGEVYFNAYLAQNRFLEGQ